MSPGAGRGSGQVQPDLFGVDHLVPGPTAPGPPSTTAGAGPGAGFGDLDLARSVIKAAGDPGYVLIGPADKVHLHTGRRVHDPAGHLVDEVEPVPGYEADTVTHLLTAGHLTTGGTHHVRAGTHSGPARSVLVPKTTRALAARLGAYRPLVPAPRPAPEQTGGTSTGTSTGTSAGTPKPARPSSGPIAVDVHRPGLGLVTCGRSDFSGSITREDGRYLVETEDGRVITRTAKSYRAGAEALARHHGYTPGPVEVDRDPD